MPARHRRRNTVPAGRAAARRPGFTRGAARPGRIRARLHYLAPAMMLAGAAAVLCAAVLPGQAAGHPSVSAARPALDGFHDRQDRSSPFAWTRPSPSPKRTSPATPQSTAPPTPQQGTVAASSPAAEPARAPGLSRSPAPPARGWAGVGFYDGHSSTSGIETAAAWLGSPSSVRYAEDFIDATSWSTIEDPWQLPSWKGSPYTMIWGVPMLPCGAPDTQCATSEADYSLVAGGGADGYYQALARNLVAAGFGSSYIRLGWEFNASWMGWGICNAAGSGPAPWAGDFVPAFRNIVTSMRSVPRADFKFIWNPIDSGNSSCAGASLEGFYPGDSYVDVVALDAYDTVGATVSDAARWTDIADGVNAGGWTAVTPDAIGGQRFPGYGLNWLAAFSARHGKEAGLPEWGLVNSSDAGGGDDTTYMTGITHWIKANATGPAVYWNSPGGTLPLDIPGYTGGGTPDATAVFRAAFGAPG